MSKIICDLCGSAYNDTEPQCPICGTERPETADFATDDYSAEHRNNGSYSYERGGHFSSRNVNKRIQTGSAKSAASKKQISKKNSRHSVNVLMIICISLVVLILLLAGYIYIRYFMPGKDTKPTDPVTVTESPTDPPKQSETEDNTTGAPEDLTCTDLQLSDTEIRLNAIGNGWLLNVIPTPGNTTDPILFSSSDPAVATVSPDGNVVAVSAGEVTITVTCGSIIKECKVVCDIVPPPEETTVPPTETTEATTAVEFKFNTPFADKVTNYQEVTLEKKGEKWCAYTGTLSLTSIKWSVGNTSVAVVDNGWVTAVGQGKTILYAEVDGVTYSCLIRCSFKK